MPDPDNNLAALGTVPADHDARAGYDDVFNATLEESEVSAELLRQFSSLQGYLDENREAYLNRTTAPSTTTAALRVISRVGREDLFSLGLVNRGTDQPLFDWFAPRSVDGIQPLVENVKFIVNHSFGRGFDENALRAGQRSVALDYSTGHNSSRFFGGIRGLTSSGGPTRPNTCAPSRAGAHHFISLRGDLINAVPWSSQCLHAEGSGGLYPGLTINDRSIGIQHEEWYLFPEGATEVEPLRDQGSYNDAVYVTNAFILKKLESWTGNDFKNYLGIGETARQNIQNNVVGCFNHSATSNYGDPGAEFLLPPEYALRETDLSTLPETRDNVSGWERRLNDWYSGISTGTQISAYARIFAIAARIRNFNLQTEVFDTSLESTLLGGIIPSADSGGVVGAAQNSAIYRLAGIERASRLVRTTRATLYRSSSESAAAVATALAARTAQLTDLSARVLTLPVIQSALGFNYATGLWVTGTTVTRTSATTGSTPVEATPPAPPPPPPSERSAIPPGAASRSVATPAPAGTRGIILFGSSSTAAGSPLIGKLQGVWAREDIQGCGDSGATAGGLAGRRSGRANRTIPDLRGAGAIILYVPGVNGEDSEEDIIACQEGVIRASSTPSGAQPVIAWALPPRWPTSSVLNGREVLKNVLDLHVRLVDEQAEKLLNLQSRGIVRLVNTERVQLLATDFRAPAGRPDPSGEETRADGWTHPNPTGYQKIAQTWTAPIAPP